MQFEYDPIKSDGNKVKHGIDFEEAQALWEDANGLKVPARSMGEARFALIARLRSRCWTAIFTLRGNRIRIISVRPSRKEEVYQYEHTTTGA